MFFLPVTCDALLYHWPFATVGLIVANVAVSVMMVTGIIDPYDGWLLSYGDGMHPEEWLLSLFTHGGFMHLLGNMFFLWTFGLVVEGKLGWLRFLACYFVIGVGQSAIEQALMLNAAGGDSCGASSAIFGLMAMACIWAPANEVKIIGTIGMFYFFSFDISVGLLAAIYVGMELGWTMVVALLGGGSMFAIQLFAWSSVLHLMGVLLGAGLGTVMLKRKVVECEHWDLFSVMRGEPGKLPAEELAPPSAEQVAAHNQKKCDEAKRKFLAYLHINQAPQALELVRKFEHLQTPLALDRNEQMALILGLHKHKRWADSAPLMAKFLEEFPDDSIATRLRLAQICLVELERPKKTLELLVPIAKAPLNDNQRLLFNELVKVAKGQIAAGAMELDEAI